MTKETLERSVPNASNRPKVFVSYSRKDLPFAQMLVDALGERGFDAFLDKTDIAPGEPWKERLGGLIAAADTVVFVISPDSVASSVCAWELEESARLGKRLIPVVARRIADADAPPALGRLNWVFCVEGDDKEAALASLESSLRTDLPWVREHTRLGDLARRWDEQKRSKSATLRGADLDAAERWLDRRPADANAPTGLHQDFIRASRRAATGRQRMWVGGSLAVAILAIGLAIFAEVNRREAQAQRDRAEHTLALATGTANSLVSDLAQKFRNAVGVPAATVKDILDRAQQLQDKLLGSGESAPALRESQANALFEASRTLLTLGETDAALATAKRAHDIVQPLADQQPDNSDLQAELSFAHTRIGDALVAQGELTQALQDYGASLAIDDRLVKSDATNVERQHDLAVDQQKIGLVQFAQGNLQEALKSFRTSLELFEKLAKEHPNDHDPYHERQDDLVAAYEKIGQVLVNQGKLDDALKVYLEGFGLAEKLMTADPNNAGRQRAFSSLAEKVGDVRLAQKDLPEALKYYQSDLDVTERMAKSDPGNTAQQRDLAVTYNKLGDVLEAQGNLPEALKSYQANLEIIERLTKSDPSNALWQNDLSASYQRVGDLLMEQRNFAEALKNFQLNLEISERLAKSDASNANLQSYLSLAYDRVGDALGLGGDAAAALTNFQAALAIREELAKPQPDNLSRQTDLAHSYAKLVSAYKELNRLPEMREALDAGREIELRLIAANPDAPQYKQELGWFDQQIAALDSKTGSAAP